MCCVSIRTNTQCTLSCSVFSLSLLIKVIAKQSRHPVFAILTTLVWQLMVVGHVAWLYFKSNRPICGVQRRRAALSLGNAYWRIFPSHLLHLTAFDPILFLSFFSNCFIMFQFSLPNFTFRNQTPSKRGYTGQFHCSHFSIKLLEHWGIENDEESCSWHIH